MTSFIHTADWQLGKLFSRVSDPDQQAALRSQRLKAIDRLATVARERQANFIDLDQLGDRLGELDYVALGDWHGFQQAGAKAWCADSRALPHQIKPAKEQLAQTGQQLGRRVSEPRTAVEALEQSRLSLTQIEERRDLYAVQRIGMLQRMLDLAATQGLQVIVLSWNPADYYMFGATEIHLRQLAGQLLTTAQTPPRGGGLPPCGEGFAGGSGRFEYLGYVLGILKNLHPPMPQT